MTDNTAKAQKLAEEIFNVIDSGESPEWDKNGEERVRKYWTKRILAAFEAERKVGFTEGMALGPGFPNQAYEEGYRHGLKEAAAVCKFLGDALPDIATAAKKQAYSCEASIRQRGQK